jgi:hypothetical protein
MRDVSAEALDVGAEAPVRTVQARAGWRGAGRGGAGERVRGRCLRSEPPESRSVPDMGRFSGSAARRTGIAQAQPQLLATGAGRPRVRLLPFKPASGHRGGGGPTGAAAHRPNASLAEWVAGAAAVGRVTGRRAASALLHRGRGLGPVCTHTHTHTHTVWTSTVTAQCKRGGAGSPLGPRRRGAPRGRPGGGTDRPVPFRARRVRPPRPGLCPRRRGASPVWVASAEAG